MNDEGTPRKALLGSDANTETHDETTETRDAVTRDAVAMPRDRAVTAADATDTVRETAAVHHTAPDNRGNPAVRAQLTRQDDPMMPLFSANETQGLRSRWENLQVGFIDEPKHAVEEADRLVSETINALSKGFAAEREKLEQQWHRGEEASTEDLRLALRRYRSFFERLLSI